MTVQEPTILQRVAAGDAPAVRECLDRYGPLVWSIVRGQLLDTAMAEDLVQEVFIDVWKSAGRFDPSVASEATFVATIARRRWIDRRRQLSRQPEVEVIDESRFVEDFDGLDHVDISDEARVARAALAELRPEQRRVLLLSIVGGLSHGQIAAKTSLPLGTVKSHVRRGLERVRALLDDPNRQATLDSTGGVQS